MSPLKPSWLLCLGLAASLHAQEAAPLPSAVSLDAADFPSLQAALDALPESGGILRLPPGTTEIREPLVLSSPETRIEGSGASTHLKNLNEEGKPALIILDRDCYGITLSANVIAYDMGGSIDLRDAHGITVSANNFSNSHIGEGQEKRVLEHENPVQLDIGHGVVLENTKHIVISGNQFSGLDGPAVRATGACDKLLINSNLTTDLNRRTPDSKEPFALSPETKATLSNNLTD